VTAHRELTLRVPVAARPAAVWAALVDWPGQRDWMLGTEVHVTGGDGASEGSELAAFTGAGGIGFLDTMRITEWDPPHRCAVAHTGRLVRGTGVFAVEPAGDDAVVVWTEALDLPLGALGAAGFAVLRPAFAAGVRSSLRRFARLVEQRQVEQRSNDVTNGDGE
jgi:hypothetical protein